MSNIKYKWTAGDVGDYRLSVGRNKNVAHVYQNPWNKGVWVVEAQAFGLDKQTFGSLMSAQVEAEIAIDDWISRATYVEPELTQLTWSLKSG